MLELTIVQTIGLFTLSFVVGLMLWVAIAEMGGKKSDKEAEQIAKSIFWFSILFAAGTTLLLS